MYHDGSPQDLLAAARAIVALDLGDRHFSRHFASALARHCGYAVLSLKEARGGLLVCRNPQQGLTLALQMAWRSGVNIQKSEQTPDLTSRLWL